MKNSREIMEIPEAYDLTGSYRAAAELVGVAATAAALKTGRFNGTVTDTAVADHLLA